MANQVTCEVPHDVVVEQICSERTCAGCGRKMRGFTDQEWRDLEERCERCALPMARAAQ